MAGRNLADEGQVKESEKEIKLRRENEIADLRKVLDTDFGRRFIWKIFGTCGIYRISFTGNSETFFNEGARNVGLKLRADVFEAKPEALLQMEIEAMKEEKTNV
jgi:hypothetical protein